MNKDIMRACGFGDAVDAVEQGQCPFCRRRDVKPEDFRDDRSLREYRISGLCQQCQDETFGK